MVLQCIKTRERLLKEYICGAPYEHLCALIDCSIATFGTNVRKVLKVQSVKARTSPTMSPPSNTSLLYVSDVCVGLVKQHLPTDPKGNTAALVSPHMKPDQGKLAGRVF